MSIIIKLDYTLDSPEDRKKLVEQILEENPEPNEAYLEILANYLVLCMEKQEKKEKKILTDNRMSTVNKRETSFEGLVSQLENGEDGIYNLMNESKTTIFQPKVTITKKDLEEIPYLQQIKDAIQWWEQKAKTATGKDAYIIKQTIIALRKDQYVIKDCYRKPVRLSHITRSKNFKKMDDSYTFAEDGSLIPSGVSFADPKVVSALLCNYSKLKEETYSKFTSDAYYMMQDLDNLVDAALAEDYPMYYELLIYKIDAKSNLEIQDLLEIDYGIKHSVEYISSLWRNKIPKLIAEKAKEKYLIWHYTEKEVGKWKRCSKCKCIKLAHNKFFSKNSTSKDGFYSICKSCRNKKK